MHTHILTDGNIIHVFKNCISISVATVLEVSKMTAPICTSHWCLVMSFGSRSAFTVTTAFTAQGHLSCGIEGGYSPNQQSLPDLRFEPTTFRLQVRLAIH